MAKRRDVPLSRKKYEEENPTISFRVPKQLKEQLEKYLAASGQSFADFVKSVLDKEEAVINERLNARIEQRFGAFKNRISLIDRLMWQALTTLAENNLPALCPRCEFKGGYSLFLVWSYQPGPSGKPEAVPTRKCPHCGWFYDIEGHINPAYLRWDDPAAALVESQRESCQKESSKRRSP